MLKLRKNKKGFTLVELIVVIAIMAVLAGTVAGVTVSQLNKQTDSNNYSTEAAGIAKAIAALVIADDTNLYSGTAWDAATLQAYLDSTAGGYGEINWSTAGADPEKSGQFSIRLGKAGTLAAFYVAYKGKQNSFRTQYWTIDSEGNYAKVATFTAS